jgi:hypothetical protein
MGVVLGFQGCWSRLMQTLMEASRARAGFAKEQLSGGLGCRALSGHLGGRTLTTRRRHLTCVQQGQAA